MQQRLQQEPGVRRRPVDKVVWGSDGPLRNTGEIPLTTPHYEATRDELFINDANEVGYADTFRT